MLKLRGSTFDGFDAANITAGIAAAWLSGGLTIPVTIGVSVIKGFLKEREGKQGMNLLKNWYSKAIQLVNKYPQFTLDKLRKNNK